MNIVDTLAIPADTPPGKYVLGLRWDCEKSAQVWSSCADIEIAAPTEQEQEQHCVGCPGCEYCDPTSPKCYSKKGPCCCSG